MLPPYPHMEDCTVGGRWALDSGLRGCYYGSKRASGQAGAWSSYAGRHDNNPTWQCVITIVRIYARRTFALRNGKARLDGNESIDSSINIRQYPIVLNKTVTYVTYLTVLLCTYVDMWGNLIVHLSTWLDILSNTSVMLTIPYLRPHKAC